ncbi:AEC family transporter [Thomasclavelia sp.]|uniref:AEC family transporter n=1 Tax=Thomasclavelia sp. TaxID=3025757 RepID=UPI0025E7F996|nr:AEC family transporter [Thomasclavelia sp.]
MKAIWYQTLIYLLIMMIGYLFKKIKLLKATDSNVLATIIINLTLPCLFFSSSLGFKLNSFIILMMLLGLIANLIMLAITYLFTSKEKPLAKGVYLISASGYDIGNFILPFTISFFSSNEVIYLSSFNVTNTIMCLGLTYVLAYYVVNHKNNFTCTDFFKQLFSSVSLDVYLLVILLAIFKLQIPDIVIDITKTIGSINIVLVMLMIGLKLDFSFNKQTIKPVFKILTLRLISAFILTGITYFLPLPKPIKSVLTITYFAPLVSVSSIYANKLGYQGDSVAKATSLSIIISLIISSIILSI